MNTNILLIPAYNPEKDIVKLVREMPRTAFSRIVVVNDGSAAESAEIFQDLSRMDHVDILVHEENRGKGAALKTGFSYVIENFKDCSGVVTADADGQHLKKDILAIAAELNPESREIVIGSRTFDSDVPFRSYFGNRLTRMIMTLFFKVELRDTQSGLRAIPMSLLPDLMKIPYNRYEFEIEMLLKARKKGCTFREIPIDTIYEDNNAASSFNPVVDSAKIYFVLFRYILASLVTAGVDYLVFFISYAISPKIFFCTYLARFIALFANFVILKRFVFHSKERVVIIGIKYLSLVVISGFISSLAIEYFHSVLNFNIVVSKVLAELLLYFAIFVVQKEFVFKQKREML